MQPWHLLIGINSKHKEEAFKFIQHHTSSEMQLINVKIGGEMPSRKSTYTDPWFTKEPISDEAKERIKWSKWINEIGKLGIYHKDYLAWREELMRAAHDVILQRSLPKDALNEYAEKYNKRAGVPK